MAQAITAENLQAEVLDAEGVILIDFWAPWCGPCQALLPVIEELAENAPEGSKICKINIDEQPELASQFGVMSIPTLKLFKGGEVVDEAIGVKSKDDLIAMIEKNV